MDSDLKDLFIEGLEKTGIESDARQYAGISRRQLRDAIADDPDFSEQVDAARERATDALEREARRRALDGTTKLVFYKGEVVGQQQEYSDSLLMFLLKGNRPEKYGDKTTIAGSKAEPLTIEVVDVLGGHTEHMGADAVRAVVTDLIASGVDSDRPAGFVDTNNAGDDLV